MGQADIIDLAIDIQSTLAEVFLYPSRPEHHEEMGTANQRRPSSALSGM